MKIFLTGGAGCLGAGLCDHWKDKHELFVLDNLATGYRESLASDVAFVNGSVTDAALVSRLISEFEPDCVVHGAAAYADPENWEGDVDANIVGTINVARACRAFDVDRVINLQTALCYGRPSELPIKVSQPTAPFTSYGISKTAAEQYLFLSGLDVLSFRLANVTGPRLAIGPIPTFYQRLSNGQDCFCSDAIRDFIDMDDFLSLMDLAICSNAVGIYNVSTGQGYSIHDIYTAVSKYVGAGDPQEVEVVPVGEDDVASVVLDPSETQSTFGWKATIDFEEMIIRILKWYDRFGVTAIYSHLAKPEAQRKLTD